VSLEFTCDAKGLRAFSSQALRSISTRGTVRVLSGVHLKATTKKLVGVTTDMEVAQRITMNVQAQPGSVLIPCKQFDTIVSTFDGDVTVKDMGERVTVSQGKTTVSVEKLHEDDFPVVPAADKKDKAVVVMADHFRPAYKFVRIAASQDQSRPVLTGIQLKVEDGRMRFAATDSYRLAFRWTQAACKEGAWDQEQILPAKPLDETARLLDDSLSFVEIRRADDRWFSFLVGNVEVLGRRIDGQFPSVDQLIPDGWDTKIEVDREPFVKSLTRVLKIGSPTVPLRLEFFKDGDDELVVKHMQQDSHELVDRVPMQPVGDRPKRGWEAFEYGINPLFAKEAAAAFDTDNITMCMISPLRPLMFRGERDDEGFLVMPIRLAG